MMENESLTDLVPVPGANVTNLSLLVTDAPAK
jgi:hypothetical protein